MFKPTRSAYHGITHLPMSDAALKKWKSKNCPKDIHCFDEVLSSEHYLVCDACGLCCHISGIETEKQSLERRQNASTLPRVVSFPTAKELSLTEEEVRTYKEHAQWIQQSAGSTDIVGQPGQALGKLILPKKPAKAKGHCNMGGA